MSKDGAPSAGPTRPVRAGQAFRRYFLTGLATLFPVAVTLWLVWFIFSVVDRNLGSVFGLTIPGLGILVTVLVIFLVGILAVHFFGRVVFQTIELWLSRLPFTKRIYPAVKQVAGFLFEEEGRQASLRGVVLAQYPRLGVYCIAFVTNETQTRVNGKEQTLLTLLLPNPPSPFTGPLIYVPKEDVVPLSMTVEDAVKFIVSGGVVAAPLEPGSRASQPEVSRS